jgi:hypothetical protein
MQTLALGSGHLPEVTKWSAGGRAINGSTQLPTNDPIDLSQR